VQISPEPAPGLRVVTRRVTGPRSGCALSRFA
jgi:hypothetical protein